MDIHHYPNYDSQKYRVFQGKAEQCALFAHHTAGGSGNSKRLGRDHLAHDSAAGVGCAGQYRVEAKLFGGSLLQTTEEDVT